MLRHLRLPRWLQDKIAGSLLFRAVGLQILLLGLWWLVLYQPALMLLRVVVEIPLTFLASGSQPPLQIDANGQWNFSIPVNTVVSDPKEGPAPKPVDAIEFAAPPENVAPFSTGWFVYLGLALALPLTKANSKRTAIGIGIQTALNALGLFFYAEINAAGILQSLHRTPDPFYTWLLKYAYHIDYLVLPYAGPFLLVLATHSAWWTQLAKPSSQQGLAPAPLPRRERLRGTES